MLNRILLLVIVVVFIEYIQGSSIVPKLTGRIVGGVDKKIEEIPYQVSLWNGTSHFCGGSLISSEWAVTAAHCLNQYDPIFVRIGSNSSLTGGQLIQIQSQLIHPHYDEKLFDYDVGLVKLMVENVNLPFIKYARFPNCHAQQCLAGDFLEVSGWGITNKNATKTAFLQSVRVPLIENHLCYDRYKAHFDITLRMMCAGYIDGGKDACQGDSGGPATCRGDLIGVVSAGFACAEPNTPGVYANLSNIFIRIWLKNVTGLIKDCKSRQSFIKTTTPYSENSSTKNNTSHQKKTIGDYIKSGGRKIKNIFKAPIQAILKLFEDE